MDQHSADINDLSFLDEVRAIIGSPETADIDMLAEVVAEYSEIATMVNRRMREIAKLLEKGLRGEAIQMAELTPPVLEIVGTMDIPEMDEWCELLAYNGMELPTRMNMRLAEEIDNAYAEQRPLEKLLKRHRALAIGKAPLHGRIYVLRQLLEHDPQNLGWNNDLEEWEAARLKQMPGELSTASKKRDLDTLKRIQSEFQVPWSVQLPNDLVHQVQNSVQQVEILNARDELKTIAVELNDSLAALDVERARHTREMWQNWVGRAQIEAEHEIYQQAAECLEWLDEEDARVQKESDFQLALENLKQGLDRSAHAEEFDRLVYAVDAFQMNVPEALRHRVVDYRQHLETQSRRRFMLWVGSVVVILVLVAAGAYLWIQQSRFNSNVAKAKEDLAGYLSNTDWKAAHSYHNALPDNIQAHSDVQAQWESITQAQNKEKEQDARFEEIFASIDERGVDDPDYAAIESAKQQARINEHSNRIAEFESRVRQRQRELLNARNQKFQAERKEWAGKVAALENAPLNKDSADQVKQAQIDIDAWRSRNKGRIAGTEKISPNLLRDVDALLNRLATRGQKITTHLEQLSRIQDIDATIGDPENFADALKAYKASYPNDTVAFEMDTTRSEQDWWIGYEKWQQLLSKPELADLTSISASTATEVFDEAQRLAKSHPNFELKTVADKCRSYLASIKAREPQGKISPDQELSESLKLSFWSDCWMINYSGKYYYIPRPNGVDFSQDPKKLVSFEYYTDASLIRDTKSWKLEKIKWRSKAPHSVLSATIRANLENVDSNGWESTFYQSINDVLNYKSAPGAPELEPILQLTMLQSLVNIAGRGSSIWNDKMADVKSSLQSVNTRGINYLSQSDRKAEEARRAARAIIDDLKLDDVGVKAIAKEIADELRSLNESLKTSQYEWKAWLYRDSSDQWAVSGMPAHQLDTDLYCLARDINGKIRMTRIGQFKDGKYEFSDENSMIAGRPVFIPKTNDQ